MARRLDPDFLEWWSGVEEKIEEIAEWDRKKAPHFNVFRLLEIDRDERRTHSRLLAALLDPKETHGQSDLFLRVFLDHDRLRDLTAQATADSWEVSVEEFHIDRGRFDIVLRCGAPRIVIVIENKVDSGEGDEQCRRYDEWLKKEAESSGWKGILVYLTPNGRMAESMKGREGEYVRMTHAEVAERMENKLADGPVDVQSIVSQYGRLVRQMKMEGEGGLHMGGDSELAEFLGCPKNVDAALRVEAAVALMRQKLLGKWFDAVIKGIETEYRVPRGACDVECSVGKPFLAIYTAKQDELGVSVQFVDEGSVYYGLCWRNERKGRQTRPNAVRLVYKKARRLLAEQGVLPREVNGWWLVPVKEDLSVEDACRSAAKAQEDRPTEIGKLLGRMMNALGCDMREANRFLRRR